MSRTKRCDGVTVSALDSSTPVLRFRHGGTDHEVQCDFIAGCDGFHGICRSSIPDGVLTAYERVYPFAWLGVLAEASPSSDELVYTYHERGFALFSMRSPTITRLYIQSTSGRPIENWSDDAIWAEMIERMATRVAGSPVGRILQRV
jgi:p-hydroxybenzoate 3-monooxygenase